MAVAGIAFAVLWHRGYLARFTRYVQQTREELRKCTWPTWNELKGSTVVIIIASLVLGFMIVAVDFLITLAVTRFMMAL